MAAKASDAQRHVLKSLLSAPDGRLRRRRLRKNQRRLRAPEFNTALDAILTAKIATLEIVGRARWVIMPAAVREAFALLGLGGGRRRRSRRASARERTSVRYTQPQAAPPYTGQRRHRRTGPPGPTDREVFAARRRSRRRKPLPLRGTTEWGRHLRALKAAYASHAAAACKRRGIVQTAKATRVRMAKHRRRQQQAATAPTIRYAAPVTSSPVQPIPGVSPSSMTGASISAALRSNQAIGRRERLVAERNRR